MQTPSVKSKKSSWLIGPFTDFSVFIATPLVIVPAYHALTALFSFTAIKLWILGVSATGHHLPGFIRAYTDRSIFTQFKYRLLVVPALLIALAVFAAVFKLSVMFFVLIVWSTWHGSMQILGFLRIYDVKSGFHSNATARLDFLMCLSWFIQVVIWSAPKKMSVISSFYLAGGPLLPVDGVRFVERGWLAFTVAVTIAYVVQCALNWRRHGYFNVPKLLCMTASFAFWGYCMITVNHLVIGLILWEIFHDLQYNVFVWKYNEQRVERNLSQSRIERFLFQSDWRKLSIYALCIIAYGAIGLLNQDLFAVYENAETYNNLLFQVGNVFAASGTIHFYLDGFIWKVRDAKVQRDLVGTAALPAVGQPPGGPAGSGPAGYRKRPKALHLAYVSLFFLAAGGLGASEYFHLIVPQPAELSDNLVDLIPASGYANFMKASRLRSGDRPDSAIGYYEAAIRSDTNYNFTHAFIGELKYRLGDREGARSHFEIAAAHDPRDQVVRENLAHLYLETGRFEQARMAYLALQEAVPLNAEYPYEVGFSLLQMKKGPEAKPFLERSLALDPQQPKAWNYLGMIEHANGRKDKAREFYLKSLALDSTYSHPRENLLALDP